MFVVLKLLNVSLYYCIAMSLFLICISPLSVGGVQNSLPPLWGRLNLLYYFTLTVLLSVEGTLIRSSPLMISTHVLFVYLCPLMIYYSVMIIYNQTVTILI